MSVISEIIPAQSFEIIRDRIGEIISDEMSNQYVLTADEELNVSVWVERTVPFDPTELPAINILYDRTDFGGQHQGHADGSNIYYIDCYSSSKTKNLQRGDVLANKNLQRLMGVCMAIMNNAQYRTLGFAPPFVMRRKVASAGVAQPAHQDTRSMAMARIVLEVKVPETTSLVDAINIASYHTTTKLELTDKGHLYIENE